MKNALRRVSGMVAVLLAAVCLMAAAGCAPAEQTQDAAAQNRAYMSQANTAMITLNADLEPFTAAIAADDVVTMEQAATNVYRDIDAFKAIKAPDAMKDIHAEYCAGCDDLKAALQGYVALFKNAADADAAELNKGIAEVQKQYDSGIAHIKAADELTTKLTGAVPESTSSSADSATQPASGSETASASATESSSQG